jgi:serine/threonine protein kinase
VNPERWQQIDALLQAALERAPHERSAFLEGACSGDEPLKSEVESLLSSADQTASLFDAPAFEAAADLLAEHVPELKAGDVLAQYMIVSLLGAGGMGEVYLAEDQDLRRKVAIKLLPAEFTSNAKRVARFRQEARAASALNHPNILTIYQISESEGHHFMATEYVEGETLRSRLSARRPTLQESLAITMQIASALSTAHAAQIIHRDIKPENIMIRPDGLVKVLDFGLAELVAEPQTEVDRNSATNPHVSSALLMGTVKYMSPEQAVGQSIGSSSDIFSLGVVLYEMLTGAPPFRGNSVQDTIKSITEESPEPIANQLSNPQPSLQRIIDKALSKAQESRYQSVEEMLADLKSIEQVKVGRSTHYQGQRYHYTRMVLLAVALVVVASTTLILVRSLRTGGRSSRAVNAEITKLTDNGRVEDATISPDGQSIIYSLSETGGLSSLWLKELPDGLPQRLTNPEANGQVGLVFSKDGSYLYFTKAEDGSIGALYKMPVSGGQPVKLIESVDTPISLSPDGQQIAYMHVDVTAGERAIMIASPDGTNSKKVYARTGPQDVGFVAWSPAGDEIICTLKEAAGDAEGNRFHVAAIGLADGRQKELLTHNWNLILNIAYLPDLSGFLMIAKRSEQDSFQIWEVSFSTGDTVKVTNDTFDHLDFRLTADGRTLLNVQVEPNNTITIEDVAAPDNYSKQIAFGNSRSDGRNGLSWTPDGRLVYAAKLDGNEDVWSMNADGTDRRRLTLSPDVDVQPTVSADGRYIVYVSRTTGRSNIWRMDADGGHQTQLTTGNAELEPTISADGKWVFFTSMDHSKRLLYRVSIDGGDSQRMSEKHIRGPAAASPDGNSLAVFFLDQNVEPAKWKILIMTPDGEPVRTINPLQPIDTFSSLKWTRDGKALTYSVSSDGKSTIYTLPIGSGSAQRRTAPAPGAITWFDWSRDGQQLAVAHITESSDAVLFRNFR